MFHSLSEISLRGGGYTILTLLAAFFQWRGWQFTGVLLESGKFVKRTNGMLEESLMVGSASQRRIEPAVGGDFADLSAPTSLPCAGCRCSAAVLLWSARGGVARSRSPLGENSAFALCHYRDGKLQFYGNLSPGRVGATFGQSVQPVLALSCLPTRPVGEIAEPAGSFGSPATRLSAIQMRFLRTVSAVDRPMRSRFRFSARFPRSAGRPSVFRTPRSCWRTSIWRTKSHVFPKENLHV